MTFSRPKKGIVKERNVGGEQRLKSMLHVLMSLFSLWLAFIRYHRSLQKCIHSHAPAHVQHVWSPGQVIIYQFIKPHEQYSTNNQVYVLWRNNQRLLVCPPSLRPVGMTIVYPAYGILVLISPDEPLFSVTILTIYHPGSPLIDDEGYHYLTDWYLRIMVTIREYQLFLLPVQWKVTISFGAIGGLACVKYFFCFILHA
jgi:hypothetical protein